MALGASVWMTMFLRTPQWIGLIAVLILATGCPTYEDAFSGTYRQVVDESSTEPVYAVDFFRYGKFAQAVLRQYDLVAPNGSGDRFVEYTECSWSNPAPFDTERAAFELVIDPARIQDSQRRLVGLINDNGRIIADLRDGNESLSLELERIALDADDDCEQDEQFFMSTAFPERNVFVEGTTYEIEDPALTVLWLGVLATTTGNGTVFSGTRQNPRQAVRLDAFLTAERDGLVNPGQNLRAPWDAPDENVLVFSGSTRYTIGHVIVVDDRDSGGAQFSWNISDEPIVASAVTRGRRESVAIEHNGFGRVILYVEGDIRDLGESMLRQMNTVSANGDLVSIAEMPDPDRHFFLADVFFFNDEIVRLDVRAQETPTTVRVTADWLSETEINLPRLFP